MVMIGIPGVSRASKKLGRLFAEENFLQVPSTGWTQTLVGGGTTTQGITAQRIRTSVTANSSSLLTLLVWNNFGSRELGAALGSQTIWWEHRLELIFNISLPASDSEAVTRIQIKQESTIGALGDKGIGLRIDNLALVGESYGSSLGTVDLATTLTVDDVVRIRIVLDPVALTIAWFVDDVLKGTQSTAGKIPTTSSNVCYLAISVANGATGGVAYLADIANPIVVQES